MKPIFQISFQRKKLFMLFELKSKFICRHVKGGGNGHTGGGGGHYTPLLWFSPPIGRCEAVFPPIIPLTPSESPRSLR